MTIASLCRWLDFYGDDLADFLRELRGRPVDDWVDIGGEGGVTRGPRAGEDARRP